MNLPSFLPAHLYLACCAITQWGTAEERAPAASRRGRGPSMEGQVKKGVDCGESLEARVRWATTWLTVKAQAGTGKVSTCAISAALLPHLFPRDSFA